jgi:endonuclease/exonuclease/phosphatase (EEP) superfamily protein YafD
MSWRLLILPLLLASSGEVAPPSAEVRATAGTEVSIVGYNVQFDSTEIDKSIDVVADAHPDIVCFTELTKGFIDEFEARLSKTYPYRSFQPAVGTWGVGIASKFPLSQVQKFEEKPYKIPGLEAVVSVGSKQVRVACLHLFPPGAKRHSRDGFLETMEKNAELRQKQAEYVTSRYASKDLSTILVGDMNDSPDGKAVTTFVHAGFVRACECSESKCGGTWPGATSLFPAVFEIDHILGRGVSFESAKVIHGGGSDHFPVFATFEIR